MRNKLFHLLAAKKTINAQNHVAIVKKLSFFNQFPDKWHCSFFSEFTFEPRLHDVLCFRQVVRFDFSALVAEIEAVGGDFEEEDFPELPRECFVQQEDAGFHAGIRLEYARWKRHNSNE